MIVHSLPLSSVKFRVCISAIKIVLLVFMLALVSSSMVQAYSSTVFFHFFFCRASRSWEIIETNLHKVAFVNFEFHGSCFILRIVEPP